MVEDQIETFEYRWINGIRGHMHVITQGTDLHLALDSPRIVPGSVIAPDPTNGFRGFVTTNEILPKRHSYSGLFAVSQMTPFDEFLVLDYDGDYKGHLNRGRDGMYAAFPLGIRVDPRNQRFQTVPEALEYIAGALNNG